MLLLDTHVWLWSVHGDSRRIGRRTRQLLARAESAEAIRVSPVTLFEVTALHTQGRIRLTRPPDQWIREALEAGGVRVAELSPRIAIDAGLIPRTALADPLDRLLIATAHHLEATFLTSDTFLLEYAGKAGHPRVHNATS
ncbi:MAG: type II toxin-antitoxin system VapC family toxin [Acidobacteria bacterium]|nr:type II toxin-antitoxin system VapC family toxin [Acidobacteriota bacterium]